MKLNIFRVTKEALEGLLLKFDSVGLRPISSNRFGKWTGTFFFSENTDSRPIPWVLQYKNFFKGNEPKNLIYYAAYLWESDDDVFVLSYGKSHFYLRQYCDHDFGTEVAKRIADENDVRQKSTKKFAGRKKKEIRSYSKKTKLDIESGESVDYLQAAITKENFPKFGKTGKFGSSVNLNPSITNEALPNFFENLSTSYRSKELFTLPRTINIDGLPETTVYEQELINEIKKIGNSTDFTTNSHDLVGVDFVFSGDEKYEFQWHRHTSGVLDEVTITELNKFISNHSVPDDQILEIKLKVTKEDTYELSRSIKESIDFIVDGQYVILTQGHWMRFNEDYLNQLDEYIDSIDLEETESKYMDISGKEGPFNNALKKDGYQVADKDFSKIKIKSGTLVEAWDARKGDTVYAVKFGSAQKLGYVCDQANNTLELLGKKANIKKLDQDFKKYCIWLAIDKVKRPEKISEINSVILKQKIESWAHKCHDLGIDPLIKISRHLK